MRAAHESLGALPARLGRFQLERALGQGALATVVRARDGEGAIWALKVLHPYLRGEATVEARFRREIALVKRVRHPHVLRIHELEVDGPWMYLVMDHHGGGDLADRLARRGPLAPAELERLGRQLCGALQAAHRAGVVHRDVKPSNILMAGEDDLDARLCDFGLARASESSELTTRAAVLGTPEYMAPEVIADGHADPRSDLYALGAVLFEAATGRPPFSGSSPHEIFRRHLADDPPDLQASRPDLGASLSAAIMRALAKDPLDRFATADAFAAALGAREVAPPLVAGARAACAACGGWFVEGAAVCADCGRKAPRLEGERPGVSVLVTAPSTGKARVGDRLDAGRHVALFALLDEWAPPAAAEPKKKKKKRAPRYPFVVARGLTRRSAERLGERLGAIGLASQILVGHPLRRADLRKKSWKLGWRYVALYAAGSYQMLNFWGHTLFRDAGLGWLAAELSLPLVGFAGGYLLLSAKTVRGLATVRSGEDRASSAIPRLAETLGGLGARQDRRLVARLMERLQALGGALGDEEGRAAVDAVGGRAAEVAEALARLREGAVPGPAPEALARAREEEQQRVVLRAALLGMAARLDALAVRWVHAQAITAAEALPALREALEGASAEAEAAHAALPTLPGGREGER